MQTKSQLVKIAIMAGVPLAILALFLSVEIQRGAHSSQPISSNLRSPRAARDAALRPAKGRCEARVWRLPLAFEANLRADGPRSSLSCAWPGLSIVLDEPGSGAHVTAGVSGRDEFG